MLFTGKIKQFNYKLDQTDIGMTLPEFNLDNFDINIANTSGLIKNKQNLNAAYSKWVTPKRTRSYPFSRIFKTMYFNDKKITVIPIIKDEGLGERKNDSNNDRINHMTFSMMSLANIYVILGWYDNFDKKTDFRITNQIMETNYINKKIYEIFNFKGDALEWNNNHFQDEFVMVLEKAASRYEELSISKKVNMHPIDGHYEFLKQFRVDRKIDMKKFAENTIPKSHQAALRESKTIHKLEKVNNDQKGVFSISDVNGGKYFLTCDEIELSERELTIIEAKNTSQNQIPSPGDIEDGIFKLLLFKNLSELKLNNNVIKPKVQLNLTGKLKKALELPNDENSILKYASYEELKKSQLRLLLRINLIAKKNEFRIILSPNE